MKAPKVEKRLLSPVEKGRIAAEIRDIEMQLRSPDLVGLRGMGGVWAANPAFSAAHSDTMTRRVQILKRRLEEGSVENLGKQAVLRREKEIKELEEQVKTRLVPRGFYHAKRQDSKDYDKTVRHLVDVEMTKETQGMISRLKNLLRARSAQESRTGGAQEDPKNASIEYLRD